MNGQRFGLLLMVAAGLLLVLAVLQTLQRAFPLEEVVGMIEEVISEVPSTEPQADLFEDPKGYQLSLPEGWTVEGRARGAEHIRGSLSDGRDGGVQIRWRPAPQAPQAFDDLAQALVISYADDMRGHWGGGFKEITRLRKPGEWLRVQFRADREDGVWFLEETILKRGPHLLIFQGGCPWEARAGFTPDLDALAASVEITRR